MLLWQLDTQIPYSIIIQMIEDGSKRTIYFSTSLFSDSIIKGTSQKD